MVIGLVLLLGGYFVLRAVIVFGKFDVRDQGGLWARFGNSIQKKAVENYAPVFSMGMESQETSENWMDYFLKVILEQVPLLAYIEEKGEYERQIESADTYENILRMEAADENEVADSGEIIHAEGAVDLEETLPERKEVERQVMEPGQVRTKKTVEYSMEDLANFQYLLRNFYAIDKTTEISEDKLNIQMLMGKDMKLKGNNANPQILIYHTHSQEGFLDSIPGDKSTTIVGVGERLSSILREEYGYNVMHHTGEYDTESRDYAYSAAGPAIEKILEENPSIEVVIDLHRDGVADNQRLITEIDGVTMAQFMFFNGLSHTKKVGDIEYLPNPYIEDNLALAFQLQLKMSEYYPSLARKIYLKGYRYNMHYRDKSLLIEAGAQTNTVEEIMNTMTPIAYILDKVLSGKE